PDGYVRMFEAARDRKPPSVDDPNGCIDRATLAKVAESASVDLSLVHADRIGERERRVVHVDETARAKLKELVDAGIPISTGTDAGNPLTLHGPAIYA